MAYLTERKFSFQSSELPSDTFEVVRFRGSEGLSRCYSFEVMLVSGNAEVDLGDVIRHPAVLSFHREDGNDVRYHGILLDFEQLHAFGGATFYRAHLVPRLHWLSLTHHNQVFLGQTAPQFIEACLKDGGLTGVDFDFRLQHEKLEPLEYVCQYGESHLDFVTRWLEREGMYYYFEQGQDREKVIFTDSLMAHTAMPQGKAIRYSPSSGLETHHLQELVSAFACRYSLTPASVLVKDYNYLKPSLEVSGTAQVDAQGRGQLYSYGDHIRTPEEGARVAKVYAESVLCRREMYYGEGSVPYVCPGFIFALQDHYRQSFNRGYLSLDVDHEGSQTGYLITGLTLQGESREVYYRNSFSAIPDSVQFRPERRTPKPRISGCISAKVDAAGSGQYAELDEHGRYKVILPFDTSGRKDGKASAWVRMASPYAGSDHGMHFPLHKDTEVLLTFIDGDPDRPIIHGAVPNPESPSVISEENATNAGFRTAGGNQLSLQDEYGASRLSLESGSAAFILYGGSGAPPQQKTQAANGQGKQSPQSLVSEGAGSSKPNTPASPEGKDASSAPPSQEERIEKLESDMTHLMTRSKYQSHGSDFYSCYGDMATSLLTSFGFNATSNAFWVQAFKTYLEKVSHNLSETDKLGKTLGATKKQDVYSFVPAIMSSCSLLLVNALKAWIFRSVGKRIDQHEDMKGNFGNAFKKHKIDWEKLSWPQKALKSLSNPWWSFKTAFLGTTGNYGVVLFSHAPHDKPWLNRVDPRSACMLNLSNGDPDVLVAASNGSVDVVGEKGVYVVSGNHVKIEAEKATLHTVKDINLLSGNSLVMVKPKEMIFEVGKDSKCFISEKNVLLLGLAENGGIKLESRKTRLDLDNQNHQISLSVVNDTLNENKEKAKIVLAEPDSSIRMDSDGQMTFYSRDKLSIDTTEKVSIGVEKATELELGNEYSTFKLSGSNVQIKADGTIKIG